MPKLPSPEVLRSLIDYNPETGALTWRERAEGWFLKSSECKRWNARYAGGPAFTATLTGGYLGGRILGSSAISAHRLAWAWVYGEWPDAEIDHINGDKADNRISNLRLVTKVTNGQNCARSRRNTSGRTGVFWHVRMQRWQSSIMVEGRLIHLGTFTDKGDAIAAREAAERKYGFHENHGRPAAA